ncbi:MULTISPECIES: poly-beta-1,6 N-acetyl-D-glucosamine export porin PgaA [unclassified Acinetobacter]|uniref:poly-beta-1,6 N-acetyl-D-glucosamine export porin PgaA n=1 Tax=unclassified Acinetobacter TaxID=196816 RepID=UPI0015D10A0E|nr:MULTISPECIES: poly-beta-1,6 N-acetyl-D-glucosamine export porin PgaA [unclassified Acinetobacter]QOW50338.1 poly-beta-1,6 N-acetyl-D-glucosamine export porin PgaA [Acinetobacter sp. YH12138]
MIYKSYLSRLCFLSIFSSLPTVVFAVDNIDQQREQSVADIRVGKVDQGFNQLQVLLAQHPENQKLIADYTLLRYANATFSSTDMAYLAKISPTTFPDYGKVSVIKALRDLKQYDQALQWAQKFYQQDQSEQWLIWQGVLLAESGQKDQAKQKLANLNLQSLGADYLSQLAYAYRLLDMPAESLNAAKYALEKQPNTDTQEQYILALLQNSDFATAQSYIQANGLNSSKPVLQHLLKMNEFSQRIQQGIQASKNAFDMKRGATAFEPLDRVLAEMSAYEDSLPADEASKRKFYYEYIYALNARNASKHALAQVEKTGQTAKEMPAYVRHALADSYLKLRQPEKAEPLYQSLFAEKNYADYNVYAGLYYSLIEQEKFKQANQLIDTMDKQLPTFVYSNAKGVDKAPHDDRTEFIALKGLNYAYRNEHEKAERYFNDLTAKAPGNIGYQNNLALIQRWREKPEQSQHTLAQQNSLEPISQGTQINRMHNFQALSQIQAWRELNQYMVSHVGDDTGVKQSKKELDDRNRASIQHQSTFAKSESDDPRVQNRLKGSREQQNWTRINSPWFYDNYRLFADHSNRWSKYESGKLKDQRIGMGLEWASDRKAASALFSQSTDGDRFGVQLDWSHWLNDHWSYALGYDSQADIPLQSLAQDHEGQAYRFALNWQQNESRKAGASYQLTDIDDGNLRQELSGYFKQQFQQSPHHISAATLRGYYGKNDPVDVPYFNPEHSYSAEVTLEHDWMTWRDYERHFNQHFAATIGTFGQKGYSSRPIYNLYYQHDWQLSRTWKLNYGIGWGSHPYDGKDEDRSYAVVGFEGRF